MRIARGRICVRTQLRACNHTHIITHIWLCTYNYVHIIMHTFFYTHLHVSTNWAPPRGTPKGRRSGEGLELIGVHSGGERKASGVRTLNANGAVKGGSEYEAESTSYHLAKRKETQRNLFKSLNQRNQEIFL